MKRHIFSRKLTCFMLVFALIACATLLYGCDDGCTIIPPDSREEVIIGSDEYRPFFFTDGDGRFSGIDVELATEAFTRMGYKATFKQIEWNRKDIMLEKGEVDCLWGSFSMSGRETVYSWAGPYMNSDQVVLVRSDSDIRSLADLNGKSVAVQATSKPDEIFSAKVASGELTLKNLFCFTAIDNVFASLRKGYADAIAGHKTAIQERVKNYSDNRYRYLDEPLVSVKLGVAFKKDTHAQLVKDLSATLAEMTRDGTTEKILREYGVDAKSALNGIDGYEQK